MAMMVSIMVTMVRNEDGDDGDRDHGGCGDSVGDNGEDDGDGGGRNLVILVCLFKSNKSKFLLQIFRFCFYCGTGSDWSILNYGNHPSEETSEHSPSPSWST